MLGAGDEDLEIIDRHHGGASPQLIHLIIKVTFVIAVPFPLHNVPLHVRPHVIGWTPEMVTHSILQGKVRIIHPRDESHLGQATIDFFVLLLADQYVDVAQRA